MLYVAPLIVNWSCHGDEVVPTLLALVAVKVPDDPRAIDVGEFSVTKEQYGVGVGVGLGVGAGLSVTVRMIGLVQVWLFTFTNDT